MKKWFMIAVSALLALLLISNIYLLAQVGALKKAPAPGGQTSIAQSVAGDLVGTWNVAAGYADGKAYLTIKPDGSFEKVSWETDKDGNDYISCYYTGYVDGNNLIYTGNYIFFARIYDSGSVIDSEGNVIQGGQTIDYSERYSNVNELPLEEYSLVTTITRHGNDVLTENGQKYGIEGTYTRQR